ncbi:hypothetical protein ACET3Z_021206 [Daucus carota]
MTVEILVKVLKEYSAISSRRPGTRKFLQHSTLSRQCPVNETKTNSETKLEWQKFSPIWAVNKYLQLTYSGK